MVYKIKKTPDCEIQRCRAKLMAKGFSHRPGTDYNETFNPVVRWDTIRTFLSIAASEGLKLSQFDVKCAFLYGGLNEEIYMKQPQGYENGTQKGVQIKEKSLCPKTSPWIMESKVQVLPSKM
ncbi:Retrovirus-related Pol polyprotein from transposon TNT 1-94 [Araneus ventricosus]|uniref:Retrovirus-related Pol polyprotein from transposon TNT 1-94 n=1 Tax=Araneus ventricosus TaxID=182803 RepID=A0A4Y2H9A5_ARAVE|nr:Retrovirus-related Pol polyprotein from transposon TNT 1-94 [Araneus ventricosus]